MDAINPFDFFVEDGSDARESTIAVSVDVGPIPPDAAPIAPDTAPTPPDVGPAQARE
ncbi:hypothetical protein ACFV4K_09450 [Nocardia sp. NPDC059764]|uniref:hypothetical protein n=1 Tax=Nocardia sp. NPDC059764 TaxID=3346939 RepID=UPI00366945CC